MRVRPSLVRPMWEDGFRTHHTKMRFGGSTSEFFLRNIHGLSKVETLLYACSPRDVW